MALIADSSTTASDITEGDVKSKFCSESKEKEDSSYQIKINEVAGSANKSSIKSVSPPAEDVITRHIDLYKFSNRQLGTEIIAISESLVALALVAIVYLAWRDPSTFLSNQKFFSYPNWHCFLPRRYYGEMILLLARSVGTVSSSLTLMVGARTRSLTFIRYYLSISGLFFGLHYTYLFLSLFINEPYATFVSFPELFIRPWMIWTVIEFAGELGYYESGKG